MSETSQRNSDDLQALLALPTDTSIEIVEGLRLSGFDLDTANDSDGAPDVSGTVQVTLFDHEISLSATYQQSSDEGRLMLAA